MNNDTLLTIQSFDYTWYIFLAVLLAIVLVFLTIKFIIPDFRNRKKYSRIFLLSLFSLLLLIDSLLIYSYLLDRKEYEIWSEVFKEQANEEINNDRIKIEYFGISPYVKTGYSKKVDSISNRYGVKLILVSDIVYNQPIEKAKEEEYNKTTNSYLDKRNGTGWRQRMDKELEPYIIRW